MAAQILFKMTCPSCEADVPIRDESRIGKKIECPKCKFRFVVEDPGNLAEDGAPTPAKKKPAKRQSNSTMLIGGGVAAAAVLVLGVVGYFLMFSGDSNAAKPIANTGGTVKKPDVSATTDSTAAAKPNETATPANATTDATKTDVAATPAGAPVQSAQPIPPAGASGDITNMLPNETMSAALINMEKLRFCTLGEQLFESKVGFRPNAFKDKLGIPVEDMQKFVRGENPEQKWSFNVIRTSKPINLKELERALQFKKGAKSPIRGRAYYEIPPNDLLDNMGTALKSEAELAKARDKDRKDEPAGPLGIAVLDETTVVIATIEPLEQFLNEDIKPLRKSKPSKSGNEADAAAPPAGAEPPKPRGGRSMNFLHSTAMLNQAPGGDDAQLTDSATFLTIDPELKAMFDRLERDLKTPPILVAAAKMQADPSILARIRSLPGLSILNGRGMRVFGLLVTRYELEKFYTTIAIEFFNENDVKELEAQMKKLLPSLAQLLGAYLGGIKVETEGADTSASSSGGGGGAARGGGGRSGPPGAESSATPAGPAGDEGPVSKLKLSRKARYLIMEGEMNLVQRAHDRIYAMTEAVVARMRGMVDMASPTPLWKEWSAGLAKLYQENGGTIPRGTFQLKEGQGGRLARNWPPSHRVSWMAAILPHLGKDDVYRQILRDHPWRDERNLKAGSILIPEFVDPRYSDRTWYAQLDSLGSRVQAATHYVGVAGIGWEAGDYKADDPKVAKKLGVFGYDRTTNIKDVADGLGNTIYVIEVPPNHQRPWIAGGGATIMGVPEQRSIRPFVNKHKDRRGTYVVMLDGSVRFIAENVSDDVFKALCTIKGGEAIEDLDKVAPKAKDGTAEMKTTAKAE